MSQKEKTIFEKVNVFLHSRNLFLTNFFKALLYAYSWHPLSLCCSVMFSVNFGSFPLDYQLNMSNNF